MAEKSQKKNLLRIVSAGEVSRIRRSALDGETTRVVEEIVNKIREGGDPALRFYSEKFGDIGPGEKLLLGKGDLESAAKEIDKQTLELLERLAKRVREFAEAQKNSISELNIKRPFGSAGHNIFPVSRAGCYAPGGRYPLPSSVLMTAVTARVAGVKEIIVASPKASQVTLAAAHIAGADKFLRVGGAHAIAALAYGTETIPPVQVIVGPGNRWVTAAKKLVYGDVSIDMLAGPSELLIIADESSDVSYVAADLLAQAEHDEDAVPMVIVLEEKQAVAINEALEEQLKNLPTWETARRALGNGFICVAKSLEEATQISNDIAPEHLQVMTKSPQVAMEQLRNYGALFVGGRTAEVFGDYGAGPNHVLPTGGTARWCGGLSVFNFLRVNTWLEIADKSSAREIIDDSIALARLEGLEAHARAAEKRR